MLKLNDKSKVFFTDTSAGAPDHIAAFTAIVRELGLVPIFYQGLTNENRKFMVANEMRGDLFTCGTLCFYLGAPTYEDNFALAFAADAVEKHGLGCLIYVEPDFDAKELERYGITLPTIIVADSAAFAERLKADLASLLRSKAVH